MFLHLKSIDIVIVHDPRRETRDVLVLLIKRDIRNVQDRVREEARSADLVVVMMVEIEVCFYTFSLVEFVAVEFVCVCGCNCLCVALLGIVTYFYILDDRSRDDGLSAFPPPPDYLQQVQQRQQQIEIQIMQQQMQQSMKQEVSDYGQTWQEVFLFKKINCFFSN